MSKKTIFLIILISVLVIIGLICGIRAIKNFYIVEKIYSSIQNNVEKDNYYLRSETIHKGETSLTKIYYKNGIGKMVAENGIYTWTNGEEAYMVDEENKTLYVLKLENSLGLVSNEMFASFIPGYGKNIFERFLMAANLQNKVKTDKLEDKKCYMIQIKEDNATKTYWIEKNSNKPIKAKIEFADGNVYEYNYQLQFNVAKIKDTELPDVSEYTKIEIQTED